MHQDGLLLQRLYFADEVHNAAENPPVAKPKIRDQERTLAERLISELSETEFHPEKYEDEYRQRLLKAIEQKIAVRRSSAWRLRPGRPPATDLVATLQASLGRKELAKVSREVKAGTRVRETAGPAEARLVAGGSPTRPRRGLSRNIGRERRSQLLAGFACSHSQE